MMKLVLIIILILVALFKYRQYKKRCPSCGEWGAMYEAGRYLQNAKNVSVPKKVKEEYRNPNGELMGTISKEIYVTAVREQFVVTERCRNCNHTVRHYTYRINNQK